jgi:predicted nuclease of predicted toxin-antitoxin system
VRVLLDENLPRGLKRYLSVYEVATVTETGWSGLADTELLRRAGDSFDVIVTADQNLEFQQNLAALKVGIVVVVVPNTRLQTIRTVVPAILTALESSGPGTVIRVTEP